MGLRRKLFVKTSQKFKIVEDIFKKIEKKDNSIQKVNLKELN